MSSRHRDTIHPTTRHCTITMIDFHFFLIVKKLHNVALIAVLEKIDLATFHHCFPSTPSLHGDRGTEHVC